MANMMVSDGKSRFRFTEEFDLHLAREVCGQNPYEEPKRWAVIQVNMIQITGKCISVRTLRERIQNLVRKHSIKSRALEGQSGIEILITELDDLQQIADLMKEFAKKKTVSSIANTDQKTSYHKGYEAREESLFKRKEENDIVEEQYDCISDCNDSTAEKNTSDLSTLDVADVIEIELSSDNTMTTNNEIFPDKQNTSTPNRAPDMQVENSKSEAPQKKRLLARRNILTPVSSRKKREGGNLRQNTLEYLEKKNQQQYEIRLKELAIQEKQQILEQQKFQLEKLEREKRLEIEERRLQMEESKTKIQLDIFANQQKLIKLVLKRDS